MLAGREKPKEDESEPELPDSALVHPVDSSQVGFHLSEQRDGDLGPMAVEPGLQRAGDMCCVLQAAQRAGSAVLPGTATSPSQQVTFGVTVTRDL